MLKAIFFDLDGTLLPMNENEFAKGYFGLLSNKMEKYGYDKNQLIKVILAGTEAMYKNDGNKTNEEVFWDYFKGIYGKEKLLDMPYFEEFYRNEFKKTKGFCKDNPYAREIVEYAKSKVEYVVLSTNPIFPYIATLERMSFVGLKEDDFDFITSYENSNYTKPNPKYFHMLLNKFNLEPEEVIIFGNNDVEDYLCGKYANIDCYLVGNSLILHEDKNIECKKINLEDIKKIIDFEIEKRK